MRLSRWRVVWAVVALAVGAWAASESTAFAQTGKAKTSKGRRPSSVANRRGVNPAGVKGRNAARPQTGVMASQRRYRGDNTDYFSKAFPAGTFPASGMDRGTLGTVDKVTDGYYIPGRGVNNGFAAPERVYGGYYTPGWGVNNGFANPYAVQGGTYMPGFGMMGGGKANPGMRPQAVQGGSYVPGFGVMGGGGASQGMGFQAVQGGGYMPGFGVMSGGSGRPATAGTQAVQGGTYIPGVGVTGRLAPGPR